MGYAGELLDSGEVVEVMGVELGRTRHAEVETWLADRGLDCDVGPSPARTSFRYDCTGLLPVSLLGDGDRGRPLLTGLLLVRPDDGAVHHVSTTRTHPDGPSAATDYGHTGTMLRARLGEPDKHLPVDDPAALEGRIIRFATEWIQPSLEVRLSILKVNDGPFKVSERWSIPSDAARQERPEGRARNPHLLAVED